MVQATPTSDLIADLTAVFQHLGNYDAVQVKLDTDEDTRGRTMTVHLESSKVTPVGFLGENRVDAISKTIILPIKMKKRLLLIPLAPSRSRFVHVGGRIRLSMALGGRPRRWAAA